MDGPYLEVSIDGKKKIRILVGWFVGRKKYARKQSYLAWFPNNFPNSFARFYFRVITQTVCTAKAIEMFLWKTCLESKIIKQYNYNIVEMLYVLE